MTHQLKPLKYKAYEELEPLYLVRDLKKQKLSALCNSARKLYDEAQAQYDARDEEQSFIFYMKYFNVLNQLKTLKDYQTNKSYVHALLGKNDKQVTAMERTEKLSTSLRRRYELMKEAEQFQEVKIPEEIKEPEKLVEKAAKSSLTSRELFDILKNDQKDVLVIDCRSREDFHESHLTFRDLLNIPEEVIMPGMTAGRLNLTLSEKERFLWLSRASREMLVLMDWSSRGPTPLRNTKLWCLRDILANWDPDNTYSNLLMLDGGFEDFLMCYPMQTTNPKAKAPIMMERDENLLEEIEYPSIGDIVMKEDNFTGDSSAYPRVDRGSKAAAIVTYEQKERFMQDLLQEQESITEKVLDMEKRRLTAEKDWEELNQIQQEKAAVEEQKQALQAKEQELLYSMLQLENKERDYLAENERLKRELEEMRAREQQTAASAAQSARIAEKELERKQIQESRKLLEQEREKKLKLAREQKKLLKENKENQIQEIPPIPNRDSKPTTHRDLAPTPGIVDRGLTGLRNVGNSCYMNSIIQCLSNSTSLTEYLIQGGFRKHVNRGAKTQGRIVEELAAVMEALWSGKYRSISPIHLKYTIGAVHSMFRDVEQQDAHEFLTILMDMLHLDLQTIPTDDLARDSLPLSEKAWLDFTKSRESVILRLFYGQIKSTVKCKECNKESATYESFSNLSLELPAAVNTRCYIETCFDMYFNGENIEGWMCPGCEQTRRAVKKLDISKLPPILVIHLKRFSADDGLSSRYRKKQNYVNFPLTNLDLSPYLTRSERTTRKMYHLYAVSNHYGTMDSGHYTAFCRNPVQDRWFKFDDQHVTSMDPGDVQSSAGYILFYSYLK
ncbi:Ubiquitin carboxyl-terminal hydrolase [Sergentomyia squamirostris]